MPGISHRVPASNARFASRSYRAVTIGSGHLSIRTLVIRARLMAEGTAAGRPRNPLDMIIAAVAEANDCTVVTDNEKDFAGLNIVNPLRAAN